MLVAFKKKNQGKKKRMKHAAIFVLETTFF